MKETPIIFQPWKVKAIYDGATQTRRVIRPQPSEIDGVPSQCKNMFDYCTGNPELGQAYYWQHGGCWNSSYTIKCSQGIPGDKLWVRETWAMSGGSYGPHGEWMEDGPIIYRANKEQSWYRKWRPSIFMPRWASRLMLEITNIRVERVQNISEEDIIKEGLTTIFREYDACVNLKRQWIKLWDSINKKPKPKKKGGVITHYESFPWDESSRDPRTKINGKPHFCYPNPWVWALTFKEVKE